MKINNHYYNYSKDILINQKMICRRYGQFQNVKYRKPLINAAEQSTRQIAKIGDYGVLV